MAHLRPAIGLGRDFYQFGVVEAVVAAFLRQQLTTMRLFDAETLVARSNSRAPVVRARKASITSRFSVGSTEQVAYSSMPPTARVGHSASSISPCSVASGAMSSAGAPA
jgi:hypothetical protein